MPSNLTAVALEPTATKGVSLHDGSAISDLGQPSDALLQKLYVDLVVARRVDEEADALAKQGALGVYASARGQEAAQVGAVATLGPEDMMFPSYRETVAAVARGVPAPDVLTLFAGDWHSGFGPSTGVMPLCTPIATHLLHAVGWAMGASRAGHNQVALAFVGDGGTSEGDFHEALNFAGVFEAPCVILVQNNQYAISVPVSEQTSAPTLAHKAVAHGIPGLRCDGQDVVAVWQASDWAVRRARDGGGPTLVEAVTYRFGPHTNNDDPQRYRSEDGRDAWLQRDPVALHRDELAARGLLSDELIEETTRGADDIAAQMRHRLFEEPSAADPMELFEHVYRDGAGHFERQRAQLLTELDANRRGG